MDEREALSLLGDVLDPVGDDAAVVEDLVLTTDMLHESTDLPSGTTPYVAGWRSVGASLSDVAAMGGSPLAAVAVYAAPTFEEAPLRSFVEGASDVCESVGARYVGGDLDTHDELTLVSTVLGRAADPVRREGARPGDVVWVTGQLGRTAAALALFDRGDRDRANELFRFSPRIEAGRTLAGAATAMMDSSDGLLRSAHRIASASGVGIALEAAPIPVHPALRVVADETDRFQRAIGVGEDFELVGTAPAAALEAVGSVPPGVTRIGRVVEGSGVTLDGDDAPDVGYTHG